ncbi:MAG: histidine phosphatase family protein [Paracoccaceae bacterium]|nr:histidine phosphatase family protein [Paracoccaceae bacterium]
MNRRFFLISAAALPLAACATAPATTSRPLALAPNSTLIVVRHADRTGEDLSALGRRRAQALVQALEGMPLDAIYSPTIQRNVDTAAPLSQARGLPIERQIQENPVPGLVRDGAGRTVIWVGNKGNIATIWEKLALTGPAPLEYGDLFIVQSDASGAVTIDRRFVDAE